MEAQEDQIREAGCVADLYAQSRQNRLNRINQVVQKPLCVGDASAEKLGPGFKGDGEESNAPTSPGDIADDVGAGLSSV